MPGGWGEPQKGVRAGVFWDGIEFNSTRTKARITNARFRIDRDVTITDTANHWSVSGGAVTDEAGSGANLSGSGEKTIASISGQWRDLLYEPHTAAFAGEISNIEYIGGDQKVTVSRTISYPAMPYQLPAAPTSVTIKRVSDSQQQAGWTNNAVLPGAPYGGLYVEVQKDSVDAAWSPLPSLPGTATAVAITTGPAATYRVRVRAGNSSGYSEWAVSDWIATTPSAPSSVVASRSGLNIVTAWVNTAAGRTGTAVEHSEGGGAWAPESVTSAAAVSYTAIAPTASATHRYRVAHEAAGVPLAAGGTITLRSDWVQTALVQLEGPPLAPLVTASQAVFDAATTDLLVAVQHKPIDASAQTAAELRWSVLGANSWTTVTLGTEDDHIFPAGTLPNSSLIEMQARTRGSAAAFGPWSSSSVFTTSQTPTAAILSPADGATIGASSTTASVLYTDPEGSAASLWQARLADADGATLWSADMPGGTTDFEVPVALSDGADYVLSARVRDGAGLWSPWVQSDLSVSYYPPPPGIVHAEWDAVSGSVTVEVTMAPTMPGEVPPVSVDIYRQDGDRWVPLAIGLTVPEALSVPFGEGAFGEGDFGFASDSMVVVDHIPPVATDVTYRVVSTSATPSSVTSYVTVATDPDPLLSGAWVNTGPGFAMTARLIGNPSLSWSRGRVRELVDFDRPAGLPVEFTGRGRKRALSLQGVVALNEDRAGRWDRWLSWEDVADQEGPFCYRDVHGRRMFVSLGDPSFNWSATQQRHMVGVSISVSEVDYVE